jgi:hypothetical protein
MKFSALSLAVLVGLAHRCASESVRHQDGYLRVYNSLRGLTMLMNNTKLHAYETDWHRDLPTSIKSGSFGDYNFGIQRDHDAGFDIWFDAVDEASGEVQPLAIHVAGHIVEARDTAGLPNSLCKSGDDGVCLRTVASVLNMLEWDREWHTYSLESTTSVIEQGPLIRAEIHVVDSVGGP